MVTKVLSEKKWLVPLLLFILNFIIKVIYLDYGSISGDEPFTIYHAQYSLSELFDLFKNENNPPLSFLLMHFWIGVFGISAFSVRFLSLIFSSLTVIYIYKIGVLSFNKRIAILASLIFTFSNYHIFFAHEARVYSLFALLTTLSMYYYFLMVRNQKTSYIIILAIINSLLIYSHFFGFFVIYIQVLSILFIKKLRIDLLKGYFYSSLLLVVFYSPYILILLHRFIESSGGTWVDEPTIVDLYNNLWKFSNAPVVTVFFIVLLLFGLALFIKRFPENRKMSPNILIILIWFLIPYITMFIISYKLPIFLDRYLVFISIGYYLLIAIVVDFLSKKKWVFYIIAVFSVILMIGTVNLKANNIRNKKQMVKQFVTDRENMIPVFICPNWVDLGIVYYYNIDFFKNYKDTRVLLEKDNIFPVNSVKEINDSLINNYNRVIYIDSWSQLVDGENLIFNKLKNRYKNIKTTKTYKGYIIHEFYN